MIQTKLANLIQDLRKANQRLKEAVKARPTRMNKDATIQRFEFCFELTWKTIQAYIRDQGLDCKSPKNCLREAVRLELIKNIKKWFKLLDNRNLIAHTYNEKLADRIYKATKELPPEIDNLLKNLYDSNQDSRRNQNNGRGWENPGESYERIRKSS